MRLTEFALMSLPAVLLALWLAGLRHARLWWFMTAALALAAIGAGLFWFGEARSLRGAYVPARLQGERIVPGGTP